jgi:hypothetical protein
MTVSPHVAPCCSISTLAGHWPLALACKPALRRRLNYFNVFVHN